jgi:hypothetical protein
MNLTNDIILDCAFSPYENLKLGVFEVQPMAISNTFWKNLPNTYKHNNNNSKYHHRDGLYQGYFSSRNKTELKYYRKEGQEGDDDFIKKHHHPGNPFNSKIIHRLIEMYIPESENIISPSFRLIGFNLSEMVMKVSKATFINYLDHYTKKIMAILSSMDHQGLFFIKDSDSSVGKGVWEIDKSKTSSYEDDIINCLMDYFNKMKSRYNSRFKHHALYSFLIIETDLNMVAFKSREQPPSRYSSMGLDNNELLDTEYRRSERYIVNIENSKVVGVDFGFLERFAGNLIHDPKRRFNLFSVHELQNKTISEEEKALFERRLNIIKDYSIKYLTSFKLLFENYEIFCSKLKKSKVLSCDFLPEDDLIQLLYNLVMDFFDKDHNKIRTSNLGYTKYIMYPGRYTNYLFKIKKNFQPNMYLKRKIVSQMVSIHRQKKLNINNEIGDFFIKLNEQIRSYLEHNRANRKKRIFQWNHLHGKHGVQRAEMLIDNIEKITKIKVTVKDQLKLIFNEISLLRSKTGDYYSFSGKIRRHPHSLLTYIDNCISEHIEVYPEGIVKFNNNQLKHGYGLKTTYFGIHMRE